MVKYLTLPIEGTIEPVGKYYARIYVHGEESKILRQYVGKKVRGIITVIIDD